MSLTKLLKSPIRVPVYAGFLGVLYSLFAIGVKVLSVVLILICFYPSYFCAAAEDAFSSTDPEA